MPSIITHYICGLKSFEKLRDTKIISEISANPDLFSLGTLGPDIFFFDVSLSVTETSESVAIGHRMHKCGINQFYKHCVDFAKNREASELKAIFVYMAGFLCHYALDSNMHPYIFYHTGFSDSHAKLKYPYGAYHKKLESAIDTILCNDILGKTPCQLDIASKINATAYERRLIADLYTYALSSAYTFNHKLRNFEKTLMCEKKFYKSFGPYHSIIKKTMRFFEGCIGKKGILSNLIHDSYISKDDTYDYLNKNKSVWYNPWDNSNPRTQCVMELFESAVSQTVYYISLLYDIIFSDRDTDAKIKRLGNKSLEGGTEVDMDFKYFDCMFEKGLS